MQMKRLEFYLMPIRKATTKERNKTPCRDGSGSIVFVFQAWGLEFDQQNSSTKKPAGVAQAYNATVVEAETGSISRTHCSGTVMSVRDSISQ